MKKEIRQFRLLDKNKTSYVFYNHVDFFDSNCDYYYNYTENNKIKYINRIINSQGVLTGISLEFKYK